jgi:hypothetical protein
MCWCRSTVTIALISGIITIMYFCACNQGAKETGKSLKYFDLKGYFEKDSTRLTKQNKLIFKSVTHNGVTQSKKMHIANWGIELSLFKESDINRPAWKDSYTVINDNDTLIYKAKYPELTTREILIKKDKQKVSWIMIFNSTKNPLYQTTEKLSYFPDSLYLIEKYQKVRLMGSNNYRIEGLTIR